MSQIKENIFGTYSGRLAFVDAEIYIGELNEEMHVEVSCCNIGSMHEKAKVEMIDETTVKFFLDMNNMDCPVHLECKGDELIGSLKINDDEIPLSFKKISNYYEFSEPYFIIPENCIELLRQNHSYEEKHKSIDLEYELNNPEVLRYLHEIGIETENKQNFDTVKELLRQLCMKIHHDGVNYTHGKEHGTIAQLKHALTNNSYTNCRGMAIIFSGILRAYGFKSSYITCLPYAENDQECHVVCEVYIEEFKKFVFIDPSNEVYFMKDDVVLNLLELRQCIQNNEVVAYCQNASHNGEKFELMAYLGYFSKNIFRFLKCINNCEDKESTKNNSICLVPIEYKEFDKDKFTVISSNINDYYQI